MQEAKAGRFTREMLFHRQNGMVRHTQPRPANNFYMKNENCS